MSGLWGCELATRAQSGLPELRKRDLSGRVQRWNGAACEWMTGLERRATVTPTELEEYFRIGRAVILTNFTDEWKAFENWTPEKLKTNYGGETVNVQKGRSKRQDFETAQHLLRCVRPPRRE